MLVKQATKQPSNQATKQPSNQATKQPSNQATIPKQLQPRNQQSRKQATKSFYPVVSMLGRKLPHSSKRQKLFPHLPCETKIFGPDLPQISLTPSPPSRLPAWYGQPAQAHGPLASCRLCFFLPWNGTSRAKAYGGGGEAGEGEGGSPKYALSNALIRVFGAPSPSPSLPPACMTSVLEYVSCAGVLQTPIPPRNKLVSSLGYLDVFSTRVDSLSWLVQK